MLIGLSPLLKNGALTTVLFGKVILPFVDGMTYCREVFETAFELTTEYSTIYCMIDGKRFQNLLFQGGHVGLKNLGATCYVNTYLQVCCICS